MVVVETGGVVVLVDDVEVVLVVDDEVDDVVDEVVSVLVVVDLVVVVEVVVDGFV